MNWITLKSPDQLEALRAESKNQTIVIFKHSTRCSISSMSLDRLLRNWKQGDEEKVEPYYLDLISFRALSDQIEDEFGVEHASPQVILVKDGKAVYDNSHFGISYSEIFSKI